MANNEPLRRPAIDWLEADALHWAMPDGLASGDWRLRKQVARALAAAKSPTTVLAGIRIALETEHHPEVLKWLGAAVFASGDIRDAERIARKRSAVRDANTRDWLLAAEIGLNPRSAHFRAIDSKDEQMRRDALVAEWAVDRPQTSKVVNQLAGASDDSASRRWATLVLLRRGASQDWETFRDNLRDADALLREWTAHSVQRRAHEPDLDEHVLEAFERERDPRVLEWLVGPALKAGANEAEIAARILVLDDAGATESLVRSILPSGSSYAEELAGQLLTAENDPVVLLSTLSHTYRHNLVSALPAVERALDVLTATPGYGEIAQGVLVKALPHSERMVLDRVQNTQVARLLLPRELRTRMSAKKSSSVAVYIALAEEQAVFLETLPVEFKMVEDPVSGNRFLEGWLTGDEADVRLLVASSGRKGTEHASTLASSLLAYSSADALVSIGISGSLSKDAPLGTVVVADEVVSYLANTKVVDVAEGYDFKRAAETFDTDSQLADAMFHTSTWFPDTHARIRQLAKSGDEWLVVRGAVACGPAVVDSPAFKDWLSAGKRDLLAVDMESAGVAVAARSARLTRPRLAVIRGISDLAAAKAESDADRAAAHRPTAMQRATLVFGGLLEAEFLVRPW